MLTFTACNNESPVTHHTVTTSVGSGGKINPAIISVKNGALTSFTITSDNDYKLESISGCGGTVVGNAYITSVVTSDCTVKVNFKHSPATNVDKHTTITPRIPDKNYNDTIAKECDDCQEPGISCHEANTACVDNTLTNNSYYVSATTLSAGGSIEPEIIFVTHGSKPPSFSLHPDNGYFLKSVIGCNGRLLNKNTYITGVMSEDCTVTAHFSPPPATAANPVLRINKETGFSFRWVPNSNASYYKLLENTTGSTDLTQVGEDILNINGIDFKPRLEEKLNTNYILRSCNEAGCIQSDSISVINSLITKLDYFVARHDLPYYQEGSTLALSEDGNTFAVGVENVIDNVNYKSGSVYIFTRYQNTWKQQAHLKANNPKGLDRFGSAISLSSDGATLAVGSYGDNSDTRGINTDQSNDAIDSGAVYVFTRNGGRWNQQAYLKASNADPGDRFGFAISLSNDGNTLAVGADYEASNARGINTDQTDNSARYAGAVYIFKRLDNSWSQQSYIKASNTEEGDRFGSTLSLSGDGKRLAVGAPDEDSIADGINGNQSNNQKGSAGAVYVFNKKDSSWEQHAYIKAKRSILDKSFGTTVSLNDNATTLLIGSYNHEVITVDYDHSKPKPATDAGVVYVLNRQINDWVEHCQLSKQVPFQLFMSGNTTCPPFEAYRNED